MGLIAIHMNVMGFLSTSPTSVLATAISSAGSTGFGTCSWYPADSAFNRSSTRAIAVSATAVGDAAWLPAQLVHFVPAAVATCPPPLPDVIRGSTVAGLVVCSAHLCTIMGV